MANLVDIIDLIHPSSNETGVIVGDQIWVLFDRAMDEPSLKGGTFFVTGPGNTVVAGPDNLLYQEDLLNLTDDTDLLASPAFDGTVQGTYSFERVSNSGLTTISGVDTTGVGTLYRTKAIFTPTTKLAANTKYTVYMSGDQNITDGLNTGALSRTVFDTVVTSSNSGDGKVTFGGSYTGSETSDTYRVKVTTSGIAGVTRFQWWRDSNPTIVETNVYSSLLEEVELNNGIVVTFDSGLYRTDDTFSAVVKKPTSYLDSFTWDFSTGSEQLSTIPTSTATTIIGDSLSVASASGVDFAVTKTTPANRATNQSTDLSQVVVTFSKEIDPTTVTADTVTVKGYPVNGDTDLFADRDIRSDITVSGTQMFIRVR